MQQIFRLFYAKKWLVVLKGACLNSGIKFEKKKKGLHVQYSDFLENEFPSHFLNESEVTASGWIFGTPKLSWVNATRCV